MENKKDMPENSRKTNEKKQEHILDDATKNYAQTIEHGKQIGKESIAKIHQITNDTTSFLKSQEYLKTFLYLFD